jgi:type I restriction enzyme S subunit
MLSKIIPNTKSVAPELPHGWELKAIGEVTQINPKLDKSAIPDNLRVSFVPMQAVGACDGTIDVSNLRSAVEVKKGFTNFREGDILFAKITPCMENGKMAVVPKVASGYGFGSTEFHVLRPKDGLDPRYLYYFVSSQSVRKEAAHNMTGAVGQKRVSTSYITNLEIPLAPPDQQHRIVAEIEKQFSRLDEAVDNLKRVKANIKRYKAAVLKAAVEGKLTAEWCKAHPDVEPASELLKRILVERKKSREEPAVSEAAKLSQLPEGWAWTTLGELIDEPKYGTAKKCDYEIDGIGVLRIPNIISGSVDTSDLKFAKFDKREIQSYELKAGDILTIRSNGSVSLVGKCALVSRADEKYLYAGYLIRMRPSQDVVCSEYLMLCLSSLLLRKQIESKAKSTSGVNNINSGELQSLILPICGKEEQKKIVGFVDEMLSRVSHLEFAADSNLKRAERLRQSILWLAFSGELLIAKVNKV